MICKYDWADYLGNDGVRENVKIVAVSSSA